MSTRKDRKQNLKNKRINLRGSIRDIINDKHLDPVLSNIMKLQPNVILVDSFLEDLLTKITFEQLIAQIYYYPDVYEGLSYRQDLWKKYYIKHYGNPDNIINNSNVNLFYEIIKLHFNESFNKDYLSSNLPTNTNIMKPNLSRIIPNFKKSDDRFIINKDNIIPFHNVKKYLHFYSIYNHTHYQGTFILFNDKTLYLLTDLYPYKQGEDLNFSKGIVDILLYNDIIITLDSKGKIKFIYTSQLIDPNKYDKVYTKKKVEKLRYDRGVKINVAMNSIKNVQENLSVSHLYLFLASSDIDYNIYFFTLSWGKSGLPSSRKILQPTSIKLEPFKQYYVFGNYNVIYITSDNKIKYDIQGYRGTINFKEKIFVKNIEIFTITTGFFFDKSSTMKENIIQFEDDSDNIYWLKYDDLTNKIKEMNPDIEFGNVLTNYNTDRRETTVNMNDIELNNDDIKIKIDIKIKKIIRQPYVQKIEYKNKRYAINTHIFYIIDYQGNVHYKLFDMDSVNENTNFFGGMQNITYIKIMVNTNFTNIKLKTKSNISDIIILSDNQADFQMILRANQNKYVIFPYYLYLYHLSKGNVIDDIILENRILFRLKGYDYIFRTEKNIVK